MNGEENRDGQSNNRSFNHGVEGPTDDPAIIAVRERQKRNFLATLLLSQGTPMMLAGDEIGRSQRGNNNAYAQDNEISWIDWSAVDERGRDLLGFAQRLIRIWKRHPILQHNRYLAGWHNPDVGVKDVTWLTPNATEMEEANWNDPNVRCFGMMLDGRAQPTGIKQRGTDETLLIVMNAHGDVVNFRLPEVPDGRQWTRMIDTAAPTWEAAAYAFGAIYEVTGRSLHMFLLNRNGSQGASKRPRRRRSKRNNIR